MTTLLIVEDEAKLAQFLLRGLQSEGYQCEWIGSYDALFPALAATEYDLILLDRMLHDSDAIELLPYIRHKQPKTLTLMLTALDGIEDKIMGLKAGADDYLAKPFDFDELLARIEALLRRAKPAEANAPQLHHGALRLNEESKRFWINDTEVELTLLEFQLLAYFLRNPDKVLSRERILNKVWSSTDDPMTNIVDVYIRRIRKKLSDTSKNERATPQENYIETIRGAGYRLNSLK